LEKSQQISIDGEVCQVQKLQTKLRRERLQDFLFASEVAVDHTLRDARLPTTSQLLSLLGRENIAFD